MKVGKSQNEISGKQVTSPSVEVQVLTSEQRKERNEAENGVQCAASEMEPKENEQVQRKQFLVNPTIVPRELNNFSPISEAIEQYKNGRREEADRYMGHYLKEVQHISEEVVEGEVINDQSKNTTLISCNDLYKEKRVSKGSKESGMKSNYNLGSDEHCSFENERKRSDLSKMSDKNRNDDLCEESEQVEMLDRKSSEASRKRHGCDQSQTSTRKNSDDFKQVKDEPRGMERKQNDQSERTGRKSSYGLEVEKSALKEKQQESSKENENSVRDTGSSFCKGKASSRIIKREERDQIKISEKESYFNNEKRSSHDMKKRISNQSNKSSRKSSYDLSKGKRLSGTMGRNRGDESQQPNGRSENDMEKAKRKESGQSKTSENGSYFDNEKGYSCETKIKSNQNRESNRKGSNDLSKGKRSSGAMRRNRGNESQQPSRKSEKGKEKAKRVSDEVKIKGSDRCQETGGKINWNLNLVDCASGKFERKGSNQNKNLGEKDSYDLDKKECASTEAERKENYQKQDTDMKTSQNLDKKKSFLEESIQNQKSGMEDESDRTKHVSDEMKRSECTLSKKPSKDIIRNLDEIKYSLTEMERKDSDQNKKSDSTGYCDLDESESNNKNITPELNLAGLQVASKKFKKKKSEIQERSNDFEKVESDSREMEIKSNEQNRTFDKNSNNKVNNIEETEGDVKYGRYVVPDKDEHLYILSESYDLDTTRQYSKQKERDEIKQTQVGQKMNRVEHISDAGESSREQHFGDALSHDLETENLSQPVTPVIIPKPFGSSQPSTSSTHCPCICPCVKEKRREDNVRNFTTSQMRRPSFCFCEHRDFQPYRNIAIYDTLTCPCVIAYLDSFKRDFFGYQGMHMLDHGVRPQTNARFLIEEQTFQPLASVTRLIATYPSMPHYIASHSNEMLNYGVNPGHRLEVLRRLAPARLYEPLFPVRFTRCPCTSYTAAFNCQYDCKYGYYSSSEESNPEP